MSDARMVDVGDKDVTRRRAVAHATLRCRPETARMVGDASLPKGDAIATARVAAVMAAKRTPDIVPLCHPLPLTFAGAEFEVDVDAGEVAITATVETTARTGVEMEALTAVTVAALTIYDMAKMVDPAMTVHDVHLVEKEGGKSGHWRAPGRDSQEPA
ncbi:MAG: cyclic pyranopterin monophosphate synthase MoaC [Acidimicrobiia bacterium]|nr:cyclic pyranopterin monophosphate synthase MoaC [Acidimicrobiia bacterium]